jgi:RNA recognition motif-containing protein
MEVDKKLGMSLDDLIKKTRSDKPNKARSGGAKKGGNKPAKKGGKLGIRKSLNKKVKTDKDTDVKMVTAGKKKDGSKKRGAVVSKNRRVVRRVSTGGAAGSRRQSTGDNEKKFSRKVVVKAGPNAPADIRRKIKIQNVPYDLSWKDIKDALSQVGKIERCDVEHGEATLVFSSNKEALRAIQTYNGGDMNGRKIRVFFV